MPKNIIICCDGTGNEFGVNNTNVVATYQLARKDTDQVAFYDPGVGTGGWEYNEATGNMRAIKDGATGFGLQRNVEDAYRFLMRRYEPGDKIFLFGFSRGAFTVRSLAGMLHKVGLLGPDDINLVEYAAKLYNTDPKDDASNVSVSADFKASFCTRCPSHFIGVWDTVDSRIMNAGKRFADASLNPDVSHAYHAVSIDERRKDFPVSLWDHPDIESSERSVQQVWFAGVHSDVGGWYDERGLANISLAWILGKAVNHGMRVDLDGLTRLYRADPADKIHESYEGFWKFRGSSVREIPEGALVHGSVRVRLEGELGYAPQNLPSNLTYTWG